GYSRTRPPSSTTGATAGERHAGRQPDPPPALRPRRDDPPGAGRRLQGDPADDHRARGRALRAVAGAGVPDRACVRSGHRGRVPVGEAMKRLSLPAAVAAAFLFGVALAGFGAALDGYSQSAHPVGLLGARGLPHALAFNAVGFVLPGGGAAVVGRRLAAGGGGRRSGPAGIGGWAGLLAAPAFTAQGLPPLDPRDPGSSARRGAGAAWTVWWVAFVPAAAMLAVG